VDVRVVAATNRDLGEEVKAGRFRQDLLFRLNAATVVLPPLRNRPREIAMLARTFLGESCKRLGLRLQDVLGRQPAFAHRLSLARQRARAQERGRLRRRHLERRDAGARAPAPAPGGGHRRHPARAALRNRAARAGEPAPAPPASKGTRAYAAPFPPIADEIRELERRRMMEALESTGWVQTRAASSSACPCAPSSRKPSNTASAAAAQRSPDDRSVAPHSRPRAARCPRPASARGEGSG
jgi:transcriptional regulator with GAF, ATPase, and Fis domain